MEANTLLPECEGLHVDWLSTAADTILVHMSAVAPYARCPCCSAPSTRVHSHYKRTLADLPWAHCPVTIRLATRKFFCDNSACQKRIFTERLPDLAAVYARKTKRLHDELYLIGYVAAGRAGAREAKGLGRNVGADTLLRLVRARAPASMPTEETLRVLGVDDWAFKKGEHYGTILIDLERHRVLDILPDRQASTLAAWLKVHKGVAILSRDRASAYAEAAREAAPNATQVADRFHLLRNLVEAVQNLLGRLHPALRRAAQQVSAPEPSTPSDPPPEPLPDPSVAGSSPAPSPQTPKQHKRAWRRQRRLSLYTEVLDRHARGESQHAIARATGLSRMTIRHYLRAGSFPERACPAGQSRTLAGFEAYLQQRLAQGCHNVAKLYRDLQEQGFTGTYQQVYRYLRRTRPRESGSARVPMLPTFPTPSPRASAWMLLLEEAPRDEKELAFLDALCAACPDVAQARELALGFFAMVRERRAADLDAWQKQVSECALPELQRFAKGLDRDKTAVLAALSQAWSNGQTEGQVNRLKLVKRSMYGRANFDLLRARVLPMAPAA